MIQFLKDFLSQPRAGECEPLVTDGRVGCPNSLNHDEDIDTCWSCPRLIDGGRDDNGQAWVRCRP